MKLWWAPVAFGVLKNLGPRGCFNISWVFWWQHYQSTYEDVCYKNTNHVEVVKITYDPNIISLKDILKIFGNVMICRMRQNDIGTQYRSVIFASNNCDLDIAIQSKEIYQKELEKNNFPKITTEINIIKNYFLAEEYHQQYLAKNPNGYCGIGGTGCSFPK